MDLSGESADPPGGCVFLQTRCFRLLGKGADSQQHHLWPLSSAGGNSESSGRRRSWSPRTGARKRRCGLAVGSWQGLRVSRACWGQGLTAAGLPPTAGKGDWEKTEQLLGAYCLPHSVEWFAYITSESSPSFEIPSVISPILEMRVQRFGEARAEILFRAEERNACADFYAKGNFQSWLKEDFF